MLHTNPICVAGQNCIYLKVIRRGNYGIFGSKRKRHQLTFRQTSGNLRYRSCSMVCIVNCPYAIYETQRRPGRTNWMATYCLCSNNSNCFRNNHLSKDKGVMVSNCSLVINNLAHMYVLRWNIDNCLVLKILPV